MGAQRMGEEVDLSAMPAVRAAVDNISQARQARASNSGMTEDVKKLLDKHKDKVPVICERSPYSTNLPELTKKKHLLKDSMLVGEVKYMIHKQLLKLMPSQSAEQTIYALRSDVGVCSTIALHFLRTFALRCLLT